MIRQLKAVSLALYTVLLLQGCHKATVEELKQKIIGNWQEVDTKNEFLDFNAEGIVQMQRPGTNHTCEYDFPDSQHLRLNCAPQGAPPRPLVWKLELKGYKLLISDGGEVGTYARHEPEK